MTMCISRLCGDPLLLSICASLDMGLDLTLTLMLTLTLTHCS